MKKILIIHLNQENKSESVRFFVHDLEILRLGCDGDVDQVRDLINAHDGEVDAIGLEGLPALLELGPARREHEVGCTLRDSAEATPVVDGRYSWTAGPTTQPAEKIAIANSPAS